ncbi:MAG: phosphoserine transaminase [Actinomycetota bacterium]|nr:phosphoserine transaminase [Actinomycetota bacterium]
MTRPALEIPAHLLPRDGRFGSGPSKVRAAQVNALSAAASSLLGTSHRQAPVRGLVRRVRDGLAELLGLPEGYEIVLGNGGSTAFWDVATFSLVAERAAHGVFGEFGAKFATATSRAPFLADSLITRAEPGGVALPEVADGVDVYAWPHNETSTGALAPVRRLGAGIWSDDGRRDPALSGPRADGVVAGSVAERPLVVVDGTSAAGAVPFDASATDVYYFAPQKVLAADGGLWLAALSPAAVARAERLAAERWIPEFLDLSVAVTNSRQDQTLNTPAVATLVLLAEQVEWLLAQGGMTWAAARSNESSSHVYTWAEARDWATPFVADPAHRSPVVATVDLDSSLDATVIVQILRDHGVLDVFPYRKLGRNQLRIATFPAVDPADVRALTASIDHLASHL